MNSFILKNTRLILVCLTALFAIRVFAQAVELVYPTALMPDFDRWYSGAISYQFLLPVQFAILVTMGSGSYWLLRLRLRESLLNSLRIFSILYFGVMFIRLLIALTGINAPGWFHFPLPAFFHLVLATYLYCITSYIRLYQSKTGEFACTHY